MATPFLKWAGGKASLISQYSEFLPTKPVAQYIEPFLGGGAMFFHLQKMGLLARAIVRLSDSNEKLIKTYRAVQRTPDSLIDRLEEMAAADDGERFYYETRERFNAMDAASSDVEVAAAFIFLNKMGFNGLYRENLKGGFSVPWGHKTRPFKPDVVNILICSDALQDVHLSVDWFESALSENTGAGTFIFLDPPYLPREQATNFGAYTAAKFAHKAHVCLEELAYSARSGGAIVLASNSDTIEAREIWSRWNIATIEARRSIGAKTSARAGVTEILAS